MKIRHALAIAACKALVLPVTAGAAQDPWQTDNCTSTQKRDEVGNIFYEHKGTEGSDTCFGTDYMDLIWMYGGDDHVSAFQGPDQIHLGSGNDVAYGGKGADVIHGGAGNDRMYGGDGHDRFYDNATQDWDRFYGGAGSDYADMKDVDIQDEFYGEAGVDEKPKVDVESCGAPPCPQDYVDMGN